MKRVVVTGLGVVAPNGVGLKAFNAAIKTGLSGIKYIEELNRLGLRCHVGGVPEVSDAVKRKYIPEHLLHRVKADNLVYGIIAGLEAWEDAHLSVNDGIDWDSGCIMGAISSNPEIIADTAHKLYNNSIKTIGARTVEQGMTSALNSYLTGFLGLGNCSISNSSACSTGTEGVIMGYERIKMGKAKRLLVGSCEGSSPVTWSAFDKIRALNATMNSSPEQASRPMSQQAKGFVPGSGAGALVLEELESALERKASIYGEIVGGSINCGGQRNGGTMTKPNTNAMKKCIEDAMLEQCIAPSAIDLISGHLTATYMDPFEVKVWNEVLRSSTRKFPHINSLKSMIGHCLAAAGSIETVAALLQLHQDYVHPSINSEDVHEVILSEIDPSRIPQTIKHQPLNYVIKASFGFGDVNSCLILKKWKAS